MCLITWVYGRQVIENYEVYDVKNEDFGNFYVTLFNISGNQLTISYLVATS